jgi:hypothetical protein
MFVLQTCSTGKRAIQEQLQSGAFLNDVWIMLSLTMFYQNKMLFSVEI